MGSPKCTSDRDSWRSSVTFKLRRIPTARGTGTRSYIHLKRKEGKLEKYQIGDMIAGGILCQEQLHSRWATLMSHNSPQVAWYTNSIQFLHNLHRWAQHSPDNHLHALNPLLDKLSTYNQQYDVLAQVYSDIDHVLLQ